MRKAANKRSRADTSSTPATKRARKGATSTDDSFQGEGQSVPNLVGSDAITLRNQQKSALLRLPTELRELIWTYAFGNRTVHPLSSRAYTAKGIGRITYHRCHEYLSDQQVYALSLQGAADDDAFKWKIDDLYKIRGSLAIIGGLAGVHNCHYNPSDAFPFLTENLVCKQVYSESETIKWKTTTFCFTDSVAFEDFVKTASAKKDLIEELTFAPGGFTNGWDAVLTPVAVGSFSSLQGVHVTLGESYWKARNSDFSKNPPSHLRHLVNLIKQFQHFPLKRERTTVMITGAHAKAYGSQDNPLPPVPACTVMMRRQAAETVREALLEWKPRRRTGRGR